MLKKFLILTLTLVLLATTAIPALAAGGPHGGNGRGKSDGNGSGTFALVGTIASLDPASRSVTVTVLSGNKLAQPFIGQNLKLQTTTATRFLLRDEDDTCTPITFADLAVGQDVSVNGRLADDVWTAKHITVGAQLIHQP